MGRDVRNTSDTVMTEIRRLAIRIGTSQSMLPTLDRTSEGVHIEIGERFAWVAIDRGKETERRETESKDEFLFWIFQSITFQMAKQYAMKYRSIDQDFRRPLFSKQLELLATLSSEWAARAEEETATILKSFPYNDRVVLE